MMIIIKGHMTFLAKGNTLFFFLIKYFFLSRISDKGAYIFSLSVHLQL